jgi:hypothetical protein
MRAVPCEQSRRCALRTAFVKSDLRESMPGRSALVFV